jgi:hypothetical protein
MYLARPKQSLEGLAVASSYDFVATALNAALQEDANRVVVLKGPWGVGKTHLWKKVAAGLVDATNQPISSVEVSLFGVRSVSDLKLKLLNEAYRFESGRAMRLKEAVGELFQGLISKISGVSASELAAILLPDLVGGKLLVIDDVERKNKALETDELLGFVEEYAERHGCKILLVLNIDPLAQDESWTTLHEKVVDAEVTLTPAPHEAFEIAAAKYQLPNKGAIGSVISALGLSNIRIIRKILALLEKLYRIDPAKDVPLQNWVPSTALLVATHYRGLKNPPTLEYLKTANSFARLLDAKGKTADPNEIEWQSLIMKLEIGQVDEFEDLVASFLSSGHLDTDKIRGIFDKYLAAKKGAELTKNFSEFIRAFWWDVQKTDEDLLNWARDLKDNADELDAGAVTDIVAAVEELGGTTLAEEILDAWVAGADARPEFQDLDERIFDSPHRKFHPRVIEKLNALRDIQHPPLEILTAVERIVKNSGWGERERIALGSSTVESYESALKRITNEPLRRFLSENVQWLRQPAFDENFKNASANFVAASKRIIAEKPTSRLSKLIKDSFASAGVAALLEG